MNKQPAANASRLEFGRVDDTADPNSFVDYLDCVAEAMQAYKRVTFGLQEITEGDMLLDLGCGAGDDARVLARHVGPTGCVLGIDNSRAMIAEARLRAAGLELPIEYRLGDAHCLPLADGTLDGARADRVFQHLADPGPALAELVRVTRSGGRIVIGDPDWETLVVDCADPRVARAFKRFLCKSLPGSSTARQLPGLMRQIGLQDVAVTPLTLLFDQLETAELVLQISHVADQARDQGTVSEDERMSWLADLHQRNDTGRFFAAVTGFFTTATKPDQPTRNAAATCGASATSDIGSRLLLG